MADCGAAGSVLDRAASALARSGGNADTTAAAGRAVASLLGKTAATSTTAAAAGPSAAAAGGGMMMPAAPPDRLYLPGSAPASAAGQQMMGGGGQQAAVVQQQQQQHRTMDDAWNGGGGGGPAQMGPMAQQRGAPPMRQMAHHHPGHHAALMHPAHAHAHHHHHHAAAMQHGQMMQRNMQMAQQAQQMQAMQHQQMMMMQQQQQRVMQQQKLQQQQKQQQSQNTKRSSAKATTNTKQQQSMKSTAAADAPPAEAATLENAAQSWHDGLEDDFFQTLENYRQEDVQTVTEDDEYSEYDDADVLGHEGYVEGASIEQLAAAWAEAEAEARAEYAEATTTGAEAQAQAPEPTVEEYADMAAAYNDAFADIDTAEAELDGEVRLAPYDFGEASASHPLSTEEGGTTPRPNIDFMAEGMKYFTAGNIPEAIRAFETEVRHIDPDNSDAWRMLGRCHAENDEDRRAIACLERAVDRDPYSVEALLALGTSYVNELDHPRALRNLKAWATHNPVYAGMNLPEAAVTETATPEKRERQALSEVKEMLQTAMEFDPAHAADAMEALGVVCNVSREYDAAIDYFRKAIVVRPDDYQLWNKLGATLANSNRSDEALPAYHKALQLKPRYARAWLNMAISHANLQNYDEAARCYLQTLSLNPSATHVWSYLRITLTCSERWDLLPAAASQNLDAFKEHFDFVQY